MPKLKFEKLDVDSTVAARVSRAKIPGGWLLIVTSNSGGGLTFYSDPEHKWDGNSLPEKGGKAALAVTRGPVDLSLRR
jgi:hypothetical protein